MSILGDSRLRTSMSYSSDRDSPSGESLSAFILTKFLFSDPFLLAALYKSSF